MALTVPMFLIRVLIALAAAAFCLIASPAMGFVSLVVLGQAHFTMAYFYQYKAGKMDGAYAARFALLFAALVIGVLWLDWGPGVHFLAAAYFVVHFLYDERHLTRDGDDFGGWMRLMPIAVIFVAMVVRNRLGFDAQFEAGAVAVAGMAVWAIAAALRGRRPDLCDVWFLVVFAIGMLLMYGSPITGAPANKNALNFIIITHYMNWYLHYIVRFRAEPAKLNPLLRHILLFNGAMALLFVSWRFLGAPIAPLGRGLFEPFWYFSWTLLHYMVTFRPADLRNWLPALARA